MMSKRQFVGPAIFLLLNALALTWLLSTFPKVLILHSYTPDYTWTKSINHYLEPGLIKRSYIKYKYYYMNSKTYYNAQVEKTTLRAINDYAPDLIIAFDDNAQKLLSKYRDKFAADTKIIFSGVNGGVDKYNYPNDAKVTGVFEHKPIAGLIYVASLLNNTMHENRAKSFHFLADKSNSSHRNIDIMRKANWHGADFTASTVDTFEQWQNFVRSIDAKKIDYLLVSGYRKLQQQQKGNNGKTIFVDPKTVAQWTQQHSPVQIIGLNSFSAEDGFSFAIGSSAAEQATEPLVMMDKILQQGISPGDIPYHYPEYFTVAINASTAQQMQQNIPVIIKSFAAASNTVYGDSLQ